LAGFTCDNMVNAEVVLASGEIVNANGYENADLHLSLRGGSNNFGIVTRIDMGALPLGQVWGGTQYYALETYTQQLQALFDFTADPDYDEYATSTMSFGANSAQAVAVNHLVYTKATPALPVKFKLFTDIPSLFGTLRQTNLSDVTNELATASPDGLR
jgi:FAD/FMN-containing dehydrogenase